MKIKVWGCRGSINCSGAEFARYGCNTTCLEIRTASGQLVVVDAGSGIRMLGKALRPQDCPAQIRFLLTHSHWDHVYGFPFFELAYSPDHTIVVCDGPHAHGAIKRFLSRQMEAPYFPVSFDVCKARFVFDCDQRRTGGTHTSCHWHELEVRSAPLSHPNGGYGYKFTDQGRDFVFLTDNELALQHPGGLLPRQYADFCRNADLLFHDAQYTDADYEQKKGWGHSTYRDAVDLAIAADVRRLGLFHHDPDRTDDDLDRQVAWCRDRIRARGSSLECFAVAEGMELRV